MHDKCDIMVEDKVYFDLGTERALGTVIAVNNETIRVTVVTGGEPIKRHITKHNVYKPKQ